MSPQVNKNLSWYQSKFMSITSLISSLIFLCGLIVTIMWYGRLLKETNEDVSWLKQMTMKQIELNAKYNYIIEHEK